MLVVKVDRNAPFERRTGNAEILDTGLYEIVDHFLFAALGINEVGVSLDIILELLLIL